MITKSVHPPPRPPSTAKAASGEQYALVPQSGPAATEPVLLHELFEETVDRYALRIAVQDAHEFLTYREVDRRANQLAHHLRGLGVGRGMHVGILLPRGSDVYIAMLATLKAGAAYVPIDSECPAERILQVAAGADMEWIVTLRGMAAPLLGCSACRLLFLDEEPASLARQPDTRIPRAVTGVEEVDPCYAIFTSGSTGAPKGVSIAHRNATHLVRAEASVFSVRKEDRVFQGFSCAFDASVEEIWLAFCAGATLVVGSHDDVRSGPDLPARLARLQITVLSTVPTLLATFREGVPSLRLLILGGEVCPQDLADRWTGQGLRVVNTYGPTETTVVATYADLLPGEPVTIGRPLPGYSVYVLGADLCTVPDGEAGELCIAGPGVALGYLKSPELTERRFPSNPFSNRSDTARLYRTGDLARRNASGELEFLGRIDEQIKLRGFRIELGEIDAQLRALPGIAAAATTVHKTTTAELLVAHVVLASRVSLDPDAVRAALRARLPTYMIPSVIQAIDAIPTLASGKTDRRALPPPHSREPSCIASGTQLLKPRELRLLSVWRQMLQTEVGLDDDFFALGGHSLLAATMVSELRVEPLFSHLSVSDVYEHPTIRSLAEASASSAKPVAERSVADTRPAPVSQRGRIAYVVAQLLALYPVIACSAFEWLTPYVVYGAASVRGLPMRTSIGLAFLSLLALYPLLFLVALSAKWLLLGRVRAGDHRLWSLYHLRFWLALRLMEIAPTAHLVGTPWLALYLRLMGARVGRDALLASDAMHVFDLLEIGDEASIGPDVRLHGYAIEDGWLRIGSISIGASCCIGTRSVLAPNTRMGDGSSLDSLSLLKDGEVVPASERWQGSPARLAARTARDVASASHPGYVPPRAVKYFSGVAYLLGGIVVSAFQLAAMLPGLALLHLFTEGDPTLLARLLAALLAAPSFVLVLALQIAAAKWLLLGRVRAGSYPVHGGFYVRKWFVDQLMELSLDLLGPLYATLYLNPWYRLLGAKVGPRAELSTAGASTPDLLTLETESFVADAVSLGTPSYDRGRMELAATHIGKRAFVGNSAVVGGGVELGELALLGVLSAAPLDRAAARRCDVSWLGSPSFELRHRPRNDGFPEQATYQPAKSLYALRLFVEYFRVTLPATVFILLATELLATLTWLASTRGALCAVALFPLVYLAFALCAGAFVVASKWLLVGCYRVGEKPLWSSWVFGNELVTSLHENLAEPWLLGWAVGTPLVPWFFRLLGARVGKWTTMNSTWLTEYDLISIADEVCLDVDCTLQTHLFEDRVMKMSSIEVGHGASIGVDSVVLYDTRVGARASLGPLSLLMKGETLPAATRWFGSPARRG